MIMTDVKMKVYAAPETSVFQVRTESSICNGSQEEIVEENNTDVTIERQGGKDWTTEFSWD